MFLPFMYILGITVGLVEVPDWKGAHIYGNIWFELFIDLYAICIILAFIPARIRRWCHHLIYIIAYTLALIDVFCWEKFSSTISPSMLLLVSETTGFRVSQHIHHSRPVCHQFRLDHGHTALPCARHHVAKTQASEDLGRKSRRYHQAKAKVSPRFPRHSYPHLHHIGRRIVAFQ